MYMRNFGEFFNNQVESAGCIILSRTGAMDEKKVAACVALLREKNPGAVIITTPWDQLTGAQILSALERRDTLEAALETIEHEQGEEHHHHYDENGVCSCGHHHDDDDDDHEHEHDHDHEHEHEHEHDHDHEHEHDHVHRHDHDHHHHHHDGHDADEVFTSWGLETAAKFTADEIREKLEELSDSFRYGTVLRAKGIVDASDGEWIHFDYTPREIDVRRGPAGVTGRLCVIGAQLKEANLAELFG